jgi:5-amino-6-(5-phospho-D-ribitylamino)uracil phosphatase
VQLDVPAATCSANRKLPSQGRQPAARVQIPIAVASTARRDRLVAGLSQAGVLSLVDVIISGEDVSRGRPDPEPYLYAAQAIERPPLRCVVIGSANASVEAAHDASMQCVAIASVRRVFELSSADLVTRNLDELSLQNLKQLFRLEEGVEPTLQTELEPEVPVDTAATALAVFDDERYLN